MAQRMNTPNRPVMTVSEVAAYLGVGRTSAYQLVNRADGPPVMRLGPQTIRVRRADLDDWLDTRVHPKTP